uniref:F-box domain-containing protein n=1 Tax=Steinernema glaseri TaxID=37863 RepID=A0A1I7ZKJ6_9BILA
MWHDCRLPDEIVSIILGFCDFDTCYRSVGLASKRFRKLALSHGPKQPINLEIERVRLACQHQEKSLAQLLLIES